MWAKALQVMPPDQMKFALNACVNTLPTNANLHLWGRKSSATCTICQSSLQSLQHILNNCPKAMELRRYSQRQDSVVKVIGAFIKSHLPQGYSITMDLPSTSYRFPHHIVPTDQRPDVVWWSDQRKELHLFELTVS